MTKKHLTLDDRQVVETMHREGCRPPEIAERVGVNVATIYREFWRGYTGEFTAERRPVYSAAVAENSARLNSQMRGRNRKVVS
jgi:IS30 family transposase